MKRWSIGFLLVLLTCVPIFLNFGRSQNMLEDGDTKALLVAIRARQRPLSWFVTDWPLENHFYRPVSTLTFELDNALHPNDAAGYGLTNAILVGLCVLVLFWFLRELTNNVALTSIGAALFALWSGGVLYQQLALLPWAVAIAALVASLFPGRRLVYGLIAFFTAAYLTVELYPNLINAKFDELSNAMIGWLPGRTASVMTLFALLSMATYARYERVSARELEVPVSPLDPPATKSTDLSRRPSRLSFLWALLAVGAAAFAFGSYEQSVMLPAALFGVALSMRLQRYRVRWLWQIPFWGLLVGYLAVRHAVIPSDVSTYQQQQLRSGMTVYIAILDYMIPCASQAWRTISSLDTTEILVAIMVPQLWAVLFSLVSNVVAYIAAHRRWVLALTGWALSVLTYLPMAWVKPFAHYVFWPMAMRSLFAATLIWVALDWFVTAASRPALQAPARPDPAPGSLPRR